MPYWEFEMTIKECEAIAEEEKKKHEEQEGKYGRMNPKAYQRQTRDMMRGYNTGSNGFGRMPSMPSMPSTPSMPKMPKI